MICAIGRCDGNNCGGCAKYVSMNSERGNNLMVEYEEEISKVTKVVADKFYKKHFGGNTNEQN